MHNGRCRSEGGITLMAKMIFIAGLLTRTSDSPGKLCQELQEPGIYHISHWMLRRKRRLGTVDQSGPLKPRQKNLRHLT